MKIFLQYLYLKLFQTYYSRDLIYTSILIHKTVQELVQNGICYDRICILMLYLYIIFKVAV